MKLITKETLSFLMDNRFHNSRDWFHEHKAQYTALVLEPLQELVARLTPTLLEIDDALITEPRVDRTISRVYRDTRFSKDKLLYRENMWCVFMRDKKLYHGPPAFYFEFSPASFRYGCGYYQASPAELQAMRDLILEGSPSFTAAKQAVDAQEVFGLEGDCYKRSKYPDAPQELRSWLDRKGISLNVNSTDFSLLFSSELAERVAQDFRLIAPVYHFFLDAHARARRD